MQLSDLYHCSLLRLGKSPDSSTWAMPHVHVASGSPLQLSSLPGTAEQSLWNLKILYKKIYKRGCLFDENGLSKLSLFERFLVSKGSPEAQ